MMPDGYGYRDRSPQVRPFRGDSGAAERNPPYRHGTNTTRQFGVSHVPPIEGEANGAQPYYLEPDAINVDNYASPATQQGLYGTGAYYTEPGYGYGDWNAFEPRLPPRRQAYDYHRRFRSPSHPVKTGMSGRRMRYQGAASRYSSDSRDSSVDYTTHRTPRPPRYGNGNHDWRPGRSPERIVERQVEPRSALAARDRDRYLIPINHRAASDEEGEYDDLPEDRVFSFAPMQAAMRSPEAEMLTSADPEFRIMEFGKQSPAVAMVNFKDKERDMNSGVSTSLAGKLLHVTKSQYVGEEAYYDGSHSVKLTVARDPKHSREPLFRWLHLHQKQLNLDELSAEISKFPNLSDEERHGFTKLLGQVRTNMKYYRTAEGRTVKHMNPGTIRIAIVGNHSSTEQGSSDKSRKRSLTWLCLPYFTLEKYSGLMSSQTAASFPPETLLQYDYAASAQERDMEQVIALAGVVSSGQCIHVNQLWSIILDDSLLITCGRMPSLTDRDGAIKIDDGPPQEISFRTKSIHVSYYRTVLWTFPLDECHTWFAFVKHFQEFWPQAIRFYHRSKIVTETEWSQVMRWARNSQVTVELRMSSHPQPPPKGILQHYQHAPHQPRDSSESASELPNSLPESVNDVFHVFTWMDIAQPSSASSTDLNLDNIIQQLSEADNYLATSTSKRARKTYDAGRLSTHDKLHAYLETTGKALDGVSDDDEDSTKRDDWASCVNLYNAAEIVFRFFLPWRFDGGAPTVGKFWGAVEALVETTLEAESEENDTVRRRIMPTVLYPYRRSIVNLAASLRDMVGAIQSFQSIFSHLTAVERSKIAVPDSLVCAWLHLVLALVQGAEDGANWRENLGIADALITKGMGEVMNSMSASSLLQAAAIQPVELLTLISQGLLQDSLGIDQSLSDTYYQYMKKLEIEINDNPDRSNQYRINQLKKELEIVQRVIRVQHGVIASILPPLPILEAVGQSRTEARILEEKIDEYEREKFRIQSKTAQMKSPAYYEREASYPLYRETALLSSNRDPDEFSKLSPIDPGGFAEFFVRECVSLLERRGNDIQDFLIEASRLETYNLTNIDITKDKQEKAVYAFTMVTIIFLPLGTISSIFGMNTSDIANMEMSQWIYWVVALPVTLLVIVGGLWWMGELQDLISWFFRWTPKNKKPRRKGNNTKFAVATSSQAQNPFAPPEAMYAVQPSLPPPPTAASIYALPPRRRMSYTSRPQRR